MPPKGKPTPKGDDGDDEKKGLELLLFTLYEEAFAYRSIKMMKIWDWRLTCAFPRTPRPRAGAAPRGGIASRYAVARARVTTLTEACPDMARAFSAGVLVYVLFFVIMDHGYLEKEAPFVGVDLLVTMVRHPGRNAAAQPALMRPTVVAQHVMAVAGGQLDDECDAI